MKKLIIILTLIVLAIWGYSWYHSNEKFNLPNDYDYQISSNIDANYHDPMVLQHYIENTYKLSSFAREQWYNHKIDVKFSDSENPLSQKASNVYETILSTTKLLELRLENSAKLKNQGFDNTQIKEIEIGGFDTKNFIWKSQFKNVEIQKGERSERVKKIQEILKKDSIQLAVDGFYNTETEKAILEYQTKHHLFPSGNINEATLIEMYQSK